MVVEQLEMQLSFQGEQRKYRHFSNVLNCEMVFSLYFPPLYEEKELSLIWWLSGLTCTDDNFSQKSGFQKTAADQAVAVIIPDTSPRGKNVPDDEGWDLGKGASFYLNATEGPWVNNYQMHTYLTEELPQLVYSLIPHFSGKESIMGHSMGGHGAIMMGLKEPERFASISAFAPILNPTQVPWGKKAFTAYLGSDESSWQEWDSINLIEQTEKVPPILITQGTADNFYDTQLQESEFLKAAKDKPVFYHSEKGYDHSYFTIATFIEEHIQFHVTELKNKK